MIDSILELKNRCCFAEELGRSHDLSPGEVSCINVIAKHEGVPLKEIAEGMNLSISRGSRVVNKLRSRGLLQVLPDAEDRRAVKLSLTDEGWECQRDLEKEKSICEKRLREGLTPEEQQIIQQGLSLLLKVM